MLYEYRSDNAVCMEKMEKAFLAQIEAVRSMGIEVQVKVLGVRPGMGEVDIKAQGELESLCQEAVTAETGKPMVMESASTDINIPLSIGIPSICFGVYRGEGAHTREEWIDAASVCSGMKAALSVLIYWFEKKAE